MKIAIPKYFSLYNTDLLDSKGKDWTPQGEYYDRLSEIFGKASDCISCGQCESVCPQHLSALRRASARRRFSRHRFGSYGEFRRRCFHRGNVQALRQKQRQSAKSSQMWRNRTMKFAKTQRNCAYTVKLQARGIASSKNVCPRLPLFFMKNAPQSVACLKKYSPRHLLFFHKKCTRNLFFGRIFAVFNVISSFLY